MKMNPPGLKRKVALSYVILIAVIAGVIAFNVKNIYSAGKAIDSADWASSLLARALQINRLEQSVFLYRSQEDRDRLMGLLSEADKMLEKNAAGETGLPGLAASLRIYRGLWDVYGNLAEGSDESFFAEEKIREEGRAALKTAEEISVRRGEARQAAIGFARNAMIASVAVILIVAGAFWFVFHRKFVRPLTMGGYALMPLLEYNLYKTVVETGQGGDIGMVKDELDGVYTEETPEAAPAVLGDDVEFEGGLYSVRTCDLGPEKAGIKTDVFHDGQVLMSKVLGYGEIGEPGMSVADKILYQHRAVITGVTMGKLKKNRSEI